MVLLVRLRAQAIAVHLVEMTESKQKLRLLAIGGMLRSARRSEHRLSCAIDKEDCVGELIPFCDPS